MNHVSRFLRKSLPISILPPTFLITSGNKCHNSAFISSCVNSTGMSSPYPLAYHTIFTQFGYDFKSLTRAWSRQLHPKQTSSSAANPALIWAPLKGKWIETLRKFWDVIVSSVSATFPIQLRWNRNSTSSSFSAFDSSSLLAVS